MPITFDKKTLSNMYPKFAKTLGEGTGKILESGLPQPKPPEMDPDTGLPKGFYFDKILKNDKTGELKAVLGENSIPITGIFESHKTGQRVARTPNGKLVPFYPGGKPASEVEQVFSAFTGSISRSSGVVVGGLNMAPAFVYGSLATRKTDGSVTGAFKGGLSSAWESLSEEGKWGVMPSDLIRAEIGKSLKDLILDSAQEHANPNFRAAGKFVAGLSEMTVDILGTVIADPVLTIPMALGKISKGAAPHVINKGGTKVFTKGQLKHADHVKAMKELVSLDSKRGDLVNFLDVLRKSPEVQTVKENIKIKVATRQKTYQEELIELRQASDARATAARIDEIDGLTKYRSNLAKLKEIQESAPKEIKYDPFKKKLDITFPLRKSTSKNFERDFKAGVEHYKQQYVEDLAGTLKVKDEFAIGGMKPENLYSPADLEKIINPKINYPPPNKVPPVVPQKIAKKEAIVKFEAEKVAANKVEDLKIAARQKMEIGPTKDELKKLGGSEKEINELAKIRQQAYDDYAEFLDDSDSMLYTFGGQLGELPKVVKGMLTIAKGALKANKHSEYDIWKQTGWFRGRDNMWRFDIDDSHIKYYGGDFNDMYLNHNSQKMLKGGRSLAAILDHDTLFNVYPELKNLPVYKVRYKAGLNTRGSFSDTGKTGFIKLNENLNRDEAQFKETLIHEIQHWIQNKEGFATGGSPSLELAIENIDFLEQYTKRTGPIEREAKVSILRHDMPEIINDFRQQDVLQQVLGKKTAAQQKIEKEITKEMDAAYKQMEALGNTKPPYHKTNFSKLQTIKDIHTKIQQLSKLRRELNEKHFSHIGETRSDLRKVQEKIGRHRERFDDLAHDAYWNLAGEREAREASISGLAKNKLGHIPPPFFRGRDDSIIKFNNDINIAKRNYSSEAVASGVFDNKPSHVKNVSWMEEPAGVTLESGGFKAMADFVEDTYLNLRTNPNVSTKGLRHLSKKISLLGDTWLTSPETMFGRTQAGKSFYNLILKARDIGEQYLSKDYRKLKGALVETRKEDIPYVRMVLDGIKPENVHISARGKVADPRIIQAAQKARSVMDGTYGRAKQLGIPELEDYRKDYFPHNVLSVEELSKGGKRVNYMLREAVRDGTFKDAQEATVQLKSYVNRLRGNESDMAFINWLAGKMNMTRMQALDVWNKRIAPKHSSQSSHLTKQRIAHVPFYDRNMTSVISSYLMDTNRGIANYKVLGNKNIKAHELIDDMWKQGGAYNEADELLRRHINPTDKEFKKPNDTINKMMAFQVMTKLNPLTTLVNYSQTLAVALQTSPAATIKSIVDMAKPSTGKLARNFAEDAGAIINTTIRDVMADSAAFHGGTGTLSGKYLQSIGFAHSERILRTLAANAGKRHAINLMNDVAKGKNLQKAIRHFDSLGLNGERIVTGERLGYEDVQLIAKRVADRTQFRGDKFDLPSGWLGPAGRLVTQYKTFIYNQAKLLKRAVWQEAKAKNYAPAAFLATAYPMVGMGYYEMIDVLMLRKEQPDSFWDAYCKGISAVGGLGLISSSIQSIAFGKKSVYEALVGPSISDLATLSQAWRPLTGSKFDYGKEIGSRSPYVGRIIRALMKEMPASRGRGSGRKSRQSR